MPVLKICSVIVCFHPDIARVVGLCESLLAGGSGVIVVDNTEAGSLEEGMLPRGCRLIALGANTGIAHAQNVGIRHAQESRADVIAFFDQDSSVDRGFLPALTSPLGSGNAQIVAPVYRDEARGTYLPSVRLGRYGWSRTALRPTGSEPQRVDIVISSGTAATKDVFRIAGPMDEDFFIDFVDTEWCMRCRSKGIPISVVPGAIMQHTIGRAAISLGIATVLVHSPTRCYYQLRNCFLLFRKPHVPLLFAVRETVSVTSSRLLLLLFVKNRAAYLEAYMSAIRDGLMGVVGRKPQYAILGGQDDQGESDEQA